MHSEEPSVNKMKILIIGKGGREHAIAWKIAQSPLVSRVFVAPGSEGIASQMPIIKTIPIEESETDKLLSFAKENAVDLTIIGPEQPLMNGLADEFIKCGLSVFGPQKAAAMIEGSKQFAKEIMNKYAIPTAHSALFSEYSPAIEYVKANGAPIVIKYDGLAAGKGVVVAQTVEEADSALKEMLIDRKFGNDKVLIEEFLDGPEFSLMALVNGKTVVPLMIAQDHKRAYDGDKGPNTGGMGAYSPVLQIPDTQVEKAIETIMKPMAIAMVEEGFSFTGILYGGLILTKDGPKVIEFNARFGDPETEIVLPKMKSDLLQHILDVLQQKETTIEWHDDTFLGVVMASTGYPESSTKNVEIKGLENIENTFFHMGTTFKDGQWLTNGGRVLFVVGQGKDITAAHENAYKAVSQIESSALFYRKDIGVGKL